MNFVKYGIVFMLTLCYFNKRCNIVFMQFLVYYDTIAKKLPKELRNKFITLVSKRRY